LKGKEFRNSPELEAELRFPEGVEMSIKSKKEASERFVIATASSYNTFDFTRELVYHLQSNFPAKRIFICDVGIRKQREWMVTAIVSIILNI
jgi:hypothetical protein